MKTMVENNHLVLFARFPVPGACKTRLIPKLGAEGAALFARAALIDTLHLFSSLPVTRTLCYTPPESAQAVQSLLDSESLGTIWRCRPQCKEPGLGARLAVALRDLQSNSDSLNERNTSTSVTFIGTDCFDLFPARVQCAVDSVTATSSPSPSPSAYMLPALDGGYVLLSFPLNAPLSIFDDIPWSSDKTAAVQKVRLQQAGLRCVLGETLLDVDDGDGLAAFMNGRENSRPRFSRTVQAVEDILGLT